MKKKNPRKLDILSAAKSLFAERGFDQTSLDAIIVASGTSKGTLYHYFESKEDLYACVLEEILQRMWSEMKFERLEEARAENFWSLVEEGWRHSVSFMLKHEQEMRLFQDFQNNMRAFHDASPTRRLREQSHELGKRIAAIGQSLGCIRTDLSPSQCAALVEALDQVTDHWFFETSELQGIPEALRSQAPIAMGLIWRVLAPDHAIPALPNFLQED